MATTYKLIEAHTLATAALSVTFSSIPQTFTDLVLKVSTRSSTANFSMFFSFNGSAVNTVNSKFGEGSGTAVSNYASSNGIAGYTGRSIQTANTFGNGEFYIPNYKSTNYKPFFSNTVNETNGTEAYIGVAGSLWSSTAPITSIEVQSFVNFVANSNFYLYGIKNS